ncbi:MAG: 3-isopropylmalate dehydratase small subunit [Candidatus Omnitrophota bacterium]
MKIEGRAHKFGKNVNTDEIIPAPYLNTTDPKELGRHCMEGIDKSFSGRVKKNDVVVAGRNFGCGSSREHAPISLKGIGVSCIIGESFARIFYRNCINTGLPILESPEAARAIKAGDVLKIDTETGKIEDVTRKKIFYAQKFPPFMQEMIKCGGLMKYIKGKKNS